MTRAGGQRLFMRMQALEIREQGRVDVKHPALPLVDEPRRQQTHEAGKADDLDAAALEHGLQRLLEGFAIFSIVGVVDDRSGDAGAARIGDAFRIRTVGNDQHDLGGIILSLAASISAAMLEPRPEIRTATRLRAIPSPCEIEASSITDLRAARRPEISPSSTTLSPSR